MTKLWSWLATMPSTNVRIAVTILMAMATAVRVLATGWNPPWEWLGFLCVWAGLDVAQFSAKRATQKDPPPPPEAGA